MGGRQTNGTAGKWRLTYYGTCTSQRPNEDIERSIFAEQWRSEQRQAFSSIKRMFLISDFLDNAWVCRNGLIGIAQGIEWERNPAGIIVDNTYVSCREAYGITMQWLVHSVEVDF